MPRRALGNMCGLKQNHQPGGRAQCLYAVFYALRTFHRTVSQDFFHLLLPAGLQRFIYSLISGGFGVY
jgi:hypothetical protein